jgi:hypothetical protein
MKTQMTILACLLLTCSVLSRTVNAEKKDASTQLIAANSMLTGLAPGALFPFIDTTPRSIVRAHVAITDATSDCHPGAAAPANVAVLAGQAGGTLVSVITAATNTGIGSKEQCVFHVTITAGESGIPAHVTDIVVVNTNKSDALTGVNTVTASADVR